jgi:hypothetical protein
MRLCHNEGARVYESHRGQSPAKALRVLADMIDNGEAFIVLSVSTSYDDKNDELVTTAVVS